MMDPFDIVNAASERQAQIRRHTETWRLLRPVRKERALRRRRAFVLPVARRFRPRREEPQPARRPAAAGE
jgi:hypothetical protein